MVLNYIWIAFFLIGFLFALAQLIFNGDSSVFKQIMDSTFSSAKTGFEVSLGLTGVLTLWMGLMKVGEEGGVIRMLTRLIGPFFAKIFPSLTERQPCTWLNDDECGC